jgi:hypothetical protein
VINLRRRKIKRARNVVRYRKLRRLEYEMLLIYVLRSIEVLQHDLDLATEAFRGMRQRKKVTYRTGEYQ